jgi:hypothetical protein
MGSSPALKGLTAAEDIMTGSPAQTSSGRDSKGTAGASVLPSSPRDRGNAVLLPGSPKGGCRAILVVGAPALAA